jgi:large conductance mechanosensitive channel
MFKGLATEFREFIARGNVIDLAVGIIMGAAFTAIVNSMVADLIMPVIGILTSGINFTNLFVALDGKEYETLKAARDAGAAVISYGQFINAIINFLIVSAVIFFLVKNVNRLKRKSAETPAAPSDEVVLLTEIRDLLKK